MSVDTNDPVVQFCAQGIQEEMTGNATAAAELYTKAWNAKSTDYQACIAAHYMARIQTTHQDVLHWNLLALQHAEQVGEDDVSAFYPSLYLNVGKSYEDLGDVAEANKFYLVGTQKIDLLPNDDLGNLTSEALKKALERTTPSAG